MRAAWHAHALRGVAATPRPAAHVPPPHAGPGPHPRGTLIPLPTFAARAARWHGLALAMLLVRHGVPTGAPAAPALGHGCPAAACPLAAPTDAESAALAAEADRLLARYVGDSTTLGRGCHALGVTMRARAADVRMLPYMWRVPDPDGLPAPVTGDAHPAEVEPGTGRVHIARGYDALNPDRGLAAILETARHEFAHLNGLGQREGWGLDAAEQLAAACAPP